jgi:uncharacterized phage protein (TIGR01671 family)
MREILFKAKRDGSGKWVEGCYAECKGKTFIGIGISIGIDAFKGFCTPVIRWFEVDPETLCQFTGLCDKNGNKIWENDILMAHLDEFYPEDVTYETIEWGVAGWAGRETDSTDRKYLDEFDTEHFEVVGNIFDQPELLQEESDE